MLSPTKSVPAKSSAVVSGTVLPFKETPIPEIPEEPKFWHAHADGRIRSV